MVNFMLVEDVSSSVLLAKVKCLKFQNCEYLNCDISCVFLHFIINNTPWNFNAYPVESFPYCLLVLFPFEKQPLTFDYDLLMLHEYLSH